jgi:hypothetical protein
LMLMMSRENSGNTEGIIVLIYMLDERHFQPETLQWEPSHMTNEALREPSRMLDGCHWSDEISATCMGRVRSWRRNPSLAVGHTGTSAQPSADTSSKHPDSASDNLGSDYSGACKCSC